MSMKVHPKLIILWRVKTVMMFDDHATVNSICKENDYADCVANILVLVPQITILVWKPMQNNDKFMRFLGNCEN